MLRLRPAFAVILVILVLACTSDVTIEMPDDGNGLPPEKEVNEAPHEEPEQQPVSEPESAAEPEPTPQSQPSPEPAPQPAAEPEPTPQSQPSPEPAPQPAAEPEPEPMPSDYSITVEAETGELKNGGQYSYIGLNSGREAAYLGDGGASVTYSFVSNYSGNMKLYAMVSDDGLHADGARNAKFKLNGLVYEYAQVSENLDCGGEPWAWRHVADVRVSEGENTLIVEKTQTTSAAFVMDKFEFTTLVKDEREGCCVGMTDDLGNACTAANYEQMKNGLDVPYLDSCAKVNDWKKSIPPSVVTTYCDQAFFECYEDCSDGHFYNICDVLCPLDSGFESCYNSCSPESLDEACDRRCD